MSKVITTAVLDNIENANKDVPYADQTQATLRRIRTAVDSLSRRGITKPNTSQVADEMQISRQQLSSWMSRRLSFSRTFSKREKVQFVNWLNREIDRLSYPTPSESVVRLLGKRKLLEEFKAHFEPKYGNDIVGAQDAFWQILVQYGAISRNVGIGEKQYTATSMRRYNFIRMRHAFD